jgi:hypothetical protein
MTDRIPLDHLTSDQYDALCDEIDRLRSGEEPGWDPLTHPTPGQWIARWNRASTAERLRVAERILADAATASQCFLMAHEKRLGEDRKAWVAVARVRDVIADMEQITGARHWARILRTAADGEQPAPTATESATVTDPAYLRQQYAAAAEQVIRDGDGGWTYDEMVTAILGVRDRHLDQLRQRLELADEMHRESETRLSHLQTSSEAAGILLTRTTDERDQLQATLREVLAMLLPKRNAHDTIVGYEPPYPITPAAVARWRAVLPETACTCGEPLGDDEDAVEACKGWLHSRFCVAVKGAQP